MRTTSARAASTHQRSPRRLSTPFRRVALVAAVLGLGAGGATAALATAGTSTTTVSFAACLNQATGAPYAVTTGTPPQTPTCSTGDRVITWGQTGPAGHDADGYTAPAGYTGDLYLGDASSQTSGRQMYGMVTHLQGCDGEQPSDLATLSVGAGSAKTSYEPCEFDLTVPAGNSQFWPWLNSSLSGPAQRRDVDIYRANPGVPGNLNRALPLNKAVITGFSIAKIAPGASTLLHVVITPTSIGLAQPLQSPITFAPLNADAITSETLSATAGVRANYTGTIADAGSSFGFTVGYNLATRIVTPPVFDTVENALAPGNVAAASAVQQYGPSSNGAGSALIPNTVLTLGTANGHTLTIAYTRAAVQRELQQLLSSADGDYDWTMAVTADKISVS